MRRSVGRVRTWTVAHAELERERTRELARIGSNLNQIARWANIHKENAEALEVVAHLVAIEAGARHNRARECPIPKQAISETLPLLRAMQFTLHLGQEKAGQSSRRG